VEGFDHFGFQFIIARSFHPFDIHLHGFGCIELLENYIRIVLLDRLIWLISGFSRFERRTRMNKRDCRLMPHLIEHQRPSRR
jgi:hypothetical protein